MSELEFQRQGVQEKFSGAEESSALQENSNRALLESLKHSTNIAADLSALYRERPYVYARVMKQLTGVLGSAKVRRLHSTVQDSARQAEASQAASLARADAKALHKNENKKSNNSSSGKAAGSSVDGKEMEKEISIFGVKTKVKYSGEGDKHTLDCKDWNIPFLKEIQGSAVLTNSKLTEIDLSATVSAAFVKESTVSIKLEDKKGTGTFMPSGTFDIDLEIPGLENLKVTFGMVKEAETTTMTGTISTQAQLFETVNVSATGDMTLGEETAINVELDANGSFGTASGAKKSAVAGGAAGGAMKAAGAGAAGANMSSKIAVTGTVGLSVANEEVTNVAGDLAVKGLGFIADPSSEVLLSVGYDGEEFSASLKNAALKPYTIPGTQATVALTIDDASYTTSNKFAATAHVDVNFWDAVKAEGDVSFDNNQLEEATLTVSADNFSIPGQKAGGQAQQGAKKGGSSVLSGSLTGTVNISDAGFNGAALSGNVNLNVAKQTVAVNLDEVDISAEGGVSGALSLGQPVTVGCATLSTCNVTFDSATDAILTKLDGALKIDHPSLKSGDPGLSINYEAGVFKCSGDVKVLQGEDVEIATSTLDVTLDSESLNATCDVTLSQDLAVPDSSSKMKILSGATAHIAIKDDKIEPLEFEGDFKYGGGAEASKNGSAAEGNSFSFSGNVSGGKYDLETGSFDGTVSGVIDSDLELGTEKVGVTLPQSYYDAGNNLTITFADSKPTTVTGRITAITDVKFKNDNLKGYITADITTFDCEKGEFTGKVMAKLTENYDLYKDKKSGESFVLQGKRQCGLNLDIEANKVTGMDLDAVAKLTIASDKIVEKKAVFDLKLQNVSVDMDTLAVSGEMHGSLAGDVTMTAHEEKTEVTVAGGSGIDAYVKDDELTKFEVNGSYSGKTGILHTATDLIFEGSAGVTVEKGEEGDYALTGHADIMLSEDCELDKIEGVDSIKLLQGSNFGVELSNDGIDSVHGAFDLTYEYAAGINEHLPEGFGAKLSGSDLVCDLTGESPMFSGTVTCEPLNNITLTTGQGAASAEFTLLAAESALTAEFAESKLKTLNGVAKFNASAGLEGTENSAKLAIENGEANLDINVITGEITSLDVKGNVSFDAQLSDQVTVKTNGCEVQSHFDATGLQTADFIGTSVEVDVKLPNSEEPLVLELASEKISYSRENSFNSDSVILKCASKTKLGEFTHGDKGFEYGLGSAEGDAATIDVAIANGQVTTISGSAGLYLNQTGEDEMGLLKVQGDVSFEYDVANDNLVGASGTVTIEEKKLFDVGDKESLWLKQSEATITIENNTLLGIKGEVNLELQDEDGAYLQFKTTGDFDCIDPDNINGTVTATIIREKSIGEVTESGYQFVVCESTGFECTLENNQISGLNGAFNFRIDKAKEALFSGSVSGSYVPGGAGTEPNLTASGTVTLMQDLDIDPAGMFKLGAGTSATANIENNDITTMDGTLIVLIEAPKTAAAENSAAQIRVEANGTIDVKSGVVKQFTGEAGLAGGDYPLGAGLNLTQLNASVTITDNVLSEISGAAGVKYENKGILVDGACDSFHWKKGAEGAQDQIGFAGHLAVSAFEGKLGGEVDVDYDTEKNGGAPTINGELDFKITDWLGGKIGVRFENGWEDPVVFGRLDVTDVELMAARSLFNFSKDLGFSATAMAGPVPITFGAGIGLGLDLRMQAIKFDASIEIPEYHVKTGKGLPAFNTSLSCSTGLDLTAALKPYLKLGVGVTGFNAGLKLTGAANFTTAATATISGELNGGEEGLSGNIGLGVSVTGNFSVDVTPSVYAELLGKEFKKDIHTWTFDLGELFSFDWGKKVIFDASGTRLEDGGDKTAMPDAAKEQTQETNETQKANMDAAYEKDDKGTEKEGGPNLPGSKELGKETTSGMPDSADQLGGIGETLTHVQNIGKALSAIGKAVSLIAGVISSAAAGGPLGVVVFVAIKILKGELTLDTFKNAFNDIKAGIESVKALLDDPNSILRDMLPDWVFELYEFFKTATLESIKEKVMEKMREKFESFGSPISELLEPVLEFVGGQFDKIAQILEYFSSGTVDGILKGIISVLGIGLSSIWDLIEMTGKMLGILKKLVKANVANGNVYYKKNNSWQIKIPGLCNFSGDGKGPVDWPIAKGVYGILKAWVGIQKT